MLRTITNFSGALRTEMVVMHARSGFNLIPRLSHTQIKKWGKPGIFCQVECVWANKTASHVLFHASVCSSQSKVLYD